MTEKKRILVQLDSDPLPSLFDRVVGVDAGAEQLFSYGGIVPETVRDLIYGAIFTRGPKDLKSTAVFVGGSDVELGEKIFSAARDACFGPLRVSIMLDSNGANTTAAAAVALAARHVVLRGARATVLAATGPVGRRAARLLAREGASVRVASRSLARAETVAQDVRDAVAGASLEALETSSESSVTAALDGADVLIAAGGAGVQLVSKADRQRAETLRFVADLNAVPPVGVEGIEPTATAVEDGSAVTYGAIGVGGLKMKIHKAAIEKLFSTNDLALDAEEIYAIGRDL